MEIVNQLRINIEELAKAAQYLIIVTTKNPSAENILSNPQEEKVLVECSLRFCRNLTELVRQPLSKDDIERLKALGAKVVNALREFIPLGLKAVTSGESKIEMISFIKEAQRFRDIIQELRQMTSKISSEYIAKRSISHLGKQFSSSIERASRAISSDHRILEPRKPPVYVMETREKVSNSPNLEDSSNPKRELHKSQSTAIRNPYKYPSASDSPISLPLRSAHKNSKSEVKTPRVPNPEKFSNSLETISFESSQELIDSIGDNKDMTYYHTITYFPQEKSNTNNNSLKMSGGSTPAVHQIERKPTNNNKSRNLSDDDEEENIVSPLPSITRPNDTLRSIKSSPSLNFNPTSPSTSTSISISTSNNNNPVRSPPVQRNTLSRGANSDKSDLSTFQVLVQFTEKLGLCFVSLGSVLESGDMEDTMKCVEAISLRCKKLLVILYGFHKELSNDPVLCQTLWDMINRLGTSYLHFNYTSTRCLENFSNSSYQLQFSAATRSFGTSIDELLEFLLNQKSRLNSVELSYVNFQPRPSTPVTSNSANQANSPNKLTRLRTENPEKKLSIMKSLGEESNNNYSDSRIRTMATSKPKTSPELSLFKNSIPELWTGLSKENVIYEDNNQNIIKFASLNRLIVELTHPDRGDIQFMKTFISTYQSFTNPTELIKLLAARYNVPPEANLPIEQIKPIQLKVINAVKFWLKTRFDDFSPDSLALVWEMIARLVQDGHTAHESLTTVIQKQLKETAVPPKELITTITTADALWINNRDPADLLYDVPVEVIALHIAVIEFDIFKKLKPSELMNSAWTKPETKHLSPHIIQLISRFNAISYWVSSLILWQERLQDRVKVMVKFIELAAALDKINSYNSLLEILAGLNNSAVARLRITHSELSRKHVSIVERLNEKMNPHQNYTHYRKLLRSCVLPCLPYLGVYLTDLIFIEEGNPDMTPDRLINFKKRRQMYNVIEEIQTYQIESYHNKEIKQSIVLYLTAPPFNDEDELYRISLIREPRGVESKASVL